MPILPSVSLTSIEDRPQALLMRWERDVRPGDTREAFRQLLQRLNQTATPLYVVVDIQSQPRFNLSETVGAALMGPFSHDKLAEWLVVGSTPVARTISSTLSAFTNRKNIRWFNAYDDVWAYLDGLNRPAAQNEKEG
ncbi:MAG: hypothetical protein MUF38_13420 [Anaerolineae bacterium]|jgi:hypothetical protein|nr:hypothetical protein [Anaerolineae bacterium]